MALRGWQEALIHTSFSLCSQTWIIPSFSNWIDISCVGEFPSFVPLSGQWFMMIVGKQWRHKKTSRPLEKLHDWALKDKTNVARCSSEHSDERVGVSSSTLIAHMILYYSYGSQLRHARINLGFLVSTSVVSCGYLNCIWTTSSGYASQCFEKKYQRTQAWLWIFRTLLITVGGLFLILNNGWFLVSTLATFECLIEKHKDKGVGVVGFLS